MRSVLTTSLSMVKYLEDWETSDVRSKQAEFSDSDWLTTESCGLATVSVSCRCTIEAARVLWLWLTDHGGLWTGFRLCFLQSVRNAKQGSQLLAVWLFTYVCRTLFAWHYPLPLELWISSLASVVLAGHWRIFTLLIRMLTCRSRSMWRFVPSTFLPFIW